MTFDTSWEKIHQEVEWLTTPSPLFVRFFEENYGKEDKSVLKFVDLGCGAGAQALYLAKQGARVVAADASNTAIIKCSRNALEMGIRDLIHFSLSDLTDLEIEPASVDCVIDICSLQNLQLNEAKYVLEKAKKWLKPDKGWVFSKMATEPFDMSLSRSDYIRLSTREDVRTIFSGYLGHTYTVAEKPKPDKLVTHLITEAWLKEAQPPCYPSRLI